MIKRKRIFAALLILLVTAFVGCDSNADTNIKIRTDSYVNTSDTIVINSYNGYKLTNSNIVENEDGSYSITLNIDKPIK